ncbi:MAG TPA: hypothetical protein VFX45_05685 [Solirubrobacterales bacterium]|nr:hypothetical protein [Solirubrobacterales bacterium]
MGRGDRAARARDVRADLALDRLRPRDQERRDREQRAAAAPVPAVPRLGDRAGHPLGASGARVLGRVALELRASGGRYGLASLCIGVGQGLAVVVEAR